MGSWTRILVTLTLLFHAATIFFASYKVLLHQSSYFPKICTIHTSLYDAHVTYTSVDPTSHVRSTAMLVLPIAGTFESTMFKVDPSGTMSIPNFIQIRLVVLKLNRSDGQTDMEALHAFILSAQCKENTVTLRDFRFSWRRV
jgi:hypothetical protein